MATVVETVNQAGLQPSYALDEASGETYNDGALDANGYPIGSVLDEPSGDINAAEVGVNGVSPSYALDEASGETYNDGALDADGYPIGSVLDEASGETYYDGPLDANGYPIGMVLDEPSGDINAVIGVNGLPPGFVLALAVIAATIGAAFGGVVGVL